MDSSSTSPSDGEESDSEPSMFWCEASKNGPRSKRHLPVCVSFWKRNYVEKELHIYYENDFCVTLQEILNKLPKLQNANASAIQEEAITILKTQKFLPNLNNLLLDHHHNIAKQSLTESLQEIESKFPCLEPGFETSSSSLSRPQRSHIFSSLRQYIFAIERMVDTIIEKRQSKDRTFTYEDYYTKIVSAFATICGFQVEEGNKSYKSVWDHFRGMNKAVCAKPYLRFRCTGDDFSKTTKTDTVTVTEVNKRGRYTEAEKNKRKRGDDSNRRAKKRKQCTVSYSSSSSSSSSSSHDCNVIFPTTESPSIEYDVGEHTLGQHAGDLLLDLHTHLQRHKGEQKPSILYMPGMIVDKSLVYLTLLEISNEHLEKLGCDEELTCEDRATIYYSLPYDMFYEGTIPSLVETFVKLNNM